MLEEYVKTHYELVKNLPNMHAFVGSTFDNFMEMIREHCSDDPTYEEFILAPVIQEMLTGKFDEKAEVLFLNVYYHAYRLYCSGENIYTISPNLCASLSNTKLNISPYFLKSPFPEIYIQVPTGVYHLLSEGRRWPVSGFYVSLQEPEEGEKLIRILVYAYDNKNLNAYGMPDDTLFYFRLRIKGDNFEEAMEDIVNNQIASSQKELFKYGGISNAHMITTFFEFIFNTLLYITSKDPDIRKQLPPDYKAAIARLKNKAKQRKAAKRAEKNTNLPILIVGKNYNLKTDINDIRKAGSINKWRLNKKVKVSGHWKLQWYGSEKDGSRHAKPIFISGYTKGPDAAEVISKRYKVGRS